MKIQWFYDKWFCVEATREQWITHDKLKTMGFYCDDNGNIIAIKGSGWAEDIVFGIVVNK